MVIKDKPQVQTEPKFRDIREFSEEQLTDPDYRLKQIARDAGISEVDMLVCSKCHHCRR